MLIKIRFDEIAAQESLAYDLFDSSGEMICHAGQTVRMKELKRKGANGLFRLQDRLSLEQTVQEVLPNFSKQEKLDEAFNQADSQAAELSSPYLIDQEEATPYLDSMFQFWKQVENGAGMDIALLDILENRLISDIVARMDQLQYLNQLHIRDEMTYSHTLDVTAISIALGVRLGLSKTDLQALALGALLHDLGKLFIPKHIMFKTTRLTDKEFEVMQLHPEIGYRIIKEQLKLPDEIALPALEHQELYTGGGYPQNLCKEEIHPFSQIVKIADVYDALTSKRPYKEPICSDKAIKIMLLEGSKSFNPAILKTFLGLANYSAPFPKELEDYA